MNRYYDALPPLLRGSALESRDRFPITWAGLDEERTDVVERALHHYLKLGGMCRVLSVTRSDLVLEVARTA